MLKDPQSAYKSGYEHGVHDAHSDPSHWYILQPGQSFAFHTQEFNSGYIAAMCKAGLQTQMTNNPPPAYTEQVQWRDAATGKLLAASDYFSGMYAGAPPAPGFGGILYYMTFNGHIMALQVLPKPSSNSTTTTSPAGSSGAG